MEIRHIPAHVGMIMDGNRRWAKLKGVSTARGHYIGICNITHIIESSIALGIPVLSMYAFSTENWKRAKTEVTALMNLMHLFLKRQTEWLNQQGTQIRVIGKIDELPAKVQQIIAYSEDITRHNHRLILNIAFNYGGQQELIHATQKLLAAPPAHPWDEATITSQLYTAGQPDVELLIRTAGEQRISNFLLWQSANAFFYSTETTWPDFKKEQLIQALCAYSQYVEHEQQLITT